VQALTLKDLLRRSEMRSGATGIGFYNGLLGWGLSLLWDQVPDRFGRVRTLMLMVLCLRPSRSLAP